MGSKLAKEGYFMADHRDSPGLSPVMEHAAGLPPGAGHGMFEAPTYTCSHCCRVVIMRPDRRRDRAWCAKCDRYICDGCGAAMTLLGECRSIDRIVDELAVAADKGATAQELERIINPLGV